MMRQREFVRKIPACFGVYCLAMALLLAVGCTLKKPAGLAEPTEQDDIMAEPTVAADETEMRTAKAETGVPSTSTESVLQSKVTQLQADVEKLQQAHTVVLGQVDSLNTRVGTVEANVNAAKDDMNNRFGNFDAEIARVRQEMAAAQQPPAAPTPAVEQPPARDVEGEVAMAVDTWRQAWQKEDTDTYIKGYQPTAQVMRISVVDGGRLRRKNLTTAQLRQSMARLFKQYARMEVLIHDFRIASDGNNRILATFEQEFTAWARARDTKPIYADKGMKTLIFTENNGVWQIVEETWGPLKR